MRNVNHTDVPSKADFRGRTVAMSEHDFHIVVDRIFKFCDVRTQTDLGIILGISPSAVSAALRNKRIPHTWLNKLSCMYCVSADYFLTGNGYTEQVPVHTLSTACVEQPVPTMCCSGIPPQLTELIRSVLKLATVDQLTDELRSRMSI